jgi:hypothetical protein
MTVRINVVRISGSNPLGPIFIRDLPKGNPLTYPDANWLGSFSNPLGPIMQMLKICSKEKK